MSKWLKLAEAFEGGADPCANSADSAESPPNGTNGAIGTASLPAHLAMGLNRLGAMPTPKAVSPDTWRAIVADSLRLRDDGWAATALAMSWTPLDLFGAGDWFEGVAVQLRGRPILALLADNTIEVPGARAAFVVDEGDGRRSAINRRAIPGGVRPLWELG